MLTEKGPEELFMKLNVNLCYRCVNFQCSLAKSEK